MDGFNKITEYLKKFKNIKLPQDIIKKNIIQSVNEKTGIVLKKEDIEIQHAVVFIKTNPIIKNEIFYKKREILDSYNKISEYKISSLK